MSISGDKKWRYAAATLQLIYGHEFWDMDITKSEVNHVFEEYLYPIQKARKTSIFPFDCETFKHIWKKIYQDSVKSKSVLRLLFVTGRTDDGVFWREPIFIISNGARAEEKSLFIDSASRVYDSWEDYKKNNVLPKGEYLFPVNGKYEFNILSEFTLETEKPPASKTGRKVLKALDVTSAACTIAGLSAGLLTLTTLPIAAPVIATACGATILGSGYSITRSSCKLADRKSHGQSISLADATARGEWFNVACTALAAGSAGGKLAAMTATRFGKEVGTIGKNVLKIFNKASRVTSLGSLNEKIQWPGADRRKITSEVGLIKFLTFLVLLDDLHELCCNDIRELSKMLN